MERVVAYLPLSNLEGVYLCSAVHCDGEKQSLKKRKEKLVMSFSLPFRFPCFESNFSNFARKVKRLFMFSWNGYLLIKVVGRSQSNSRFLFSVEANSEIATEGLTSHSQLFEFNLVNTSQSLGASFASIWSEIVSGKVAEKVDCLTLGRGKTIWLGIGHAWSLVSESSIALLLFSVDNDATVNKNNSITC